MGGGGEVREGEAGDIFAKNNTLFFVCYKTVFFK